ncbi:MAG: hypothetical protein OK454_12440 [Thaumarchaeota archaeon]|nr:hypothetical protein [Nitrososphaerota archaeon]
MLAQRTTPNYELSEFPCYEVLSRTYIEPVLLEKGAIIEYVGSPGPHLFPLNALAKAAFEDWYNEEHVLNDKDGEPILYINEKGERVLKMYKPHLAFRRTEYVPAEKARFNLVAPPPAPTTPELNHTLGGLGIKTATPDLRPGPDRPHTPDQSLSAADVLLAGAQSGARIPKRNLAAELRAESAAGANLASAARAAAEGAI